MGVDEYRKHRIGDVSGMQLMNHIKIKMISRLIIKIEFIWRVMC
jgi:hypothetical protein